MEQKSSLKTSTCGCKRKATEQKTPEHSLHSVTEMLHFSSWKSLVALISHIFARIQKNMLILTD